MPKDDHHSMTLFLHKQIVVHSYNVTSCNNEKIMFWKVFPNTKFLKYFKTGWENIYNTKYMGVYSVYYLS